QVVGGVSGQVELVVGDAGVGGCHIVGVADVGFTDLDEPTTPGQQIQGGVHEIPCQTIQNHVHTATTGGVQEDAARGEGARGGDVVGGDTRGMQQVVFVGVGGGERLGAPMAGELDRGHPHSTRGGVDEHPLPRLQLGDLDQGGVGGGEHHRNR